MNKSGNNNRSVRNTKKKLRDGLLKLMETKQFTQISVKELTELVDVNRGTFYFHYEDVYDMLSKIEGEFFMGFNTLLEQTPETEQFSDGMGGYSFIALARFMYDNRDFCRIMMSPNGDMAFLAQLKNIISDKCSNFLKSADPQCDPKKYENFNAFIVNGCLGIMTRWLGGNTSETPEDIAEIMEKIMLSSLEAYITK